MSCPDCFRGHEHEGTPKGKIETIHGRPTYVATPNDKLEEGQEGVNVKGIVVIIPDAYGWEFTNNRLMADHYAREGGYLVYLPDFMDGEFFFLLRRVELNNGTGCEARNEN
jgi:hypothetical protein